MIRKEELKQVAEDKIKEIGGYLVDLKIDINNVTRIYFDRYDGVLVDHCLAVSRHIEERFDRDHEDYELTVCSAGLDKPFLVKEQYDKNIGNEVKVLLKNGERRKGKILSFNGVLVLEVKHKIKGSKKINIKEEKIPFSQIKETKLKINFK